MRPTALESLRGIQSGLVEAVAPELSSAYAQDVAQTIQMLLESLAGEADTAAHNLRADNEALATLLSQANTAIGALPMRNERLSAFVSEIEGVLAESDDGSLAVSALTVRNDGLRSTLERLLMAFEDLVDQPGMQVLNAVRAAIYAHLRRVAVRGWSFWDVSSFRERMARVKAESSQVTE